MKQKPKKSHEVTRRLTKAWEFDAPKENRQLWYFDFETKTFESRSSSTLLRSPHFFGEDVEAWLNKMIETPLAEYIDRTEQNDIAVPSVVEERMERAIALSVSLQAVRHLAATGAQRARDELRDYPKKPETYWDDLLGRILAERRFIGGTIRSGARLFFPEFGLAVLPVFGGPVGWFQPISPTRYIGCVPSRVATDGLDRALKMMAHLGAMSALSVGLKGSKVIVPPDTIQQDHEVAAQHIVSLREDAKAFTIITVRQNEAAGIPRSEQF